METGRNTEKISKGIEANPQNQRTGTRVIREAQSSRSISKRRVRTRRQIHSMHGHALHRNLLMPISVHKLEYVDLKPAYLLPLHDVQHLPIDS